MRRNNQGKTAKMTTKTEAIKKKKEEKFERNLVKYKELPEYLQDNEFILDYYRCEWPLKDALFSFFTLHNESLNIWTHVVGFLIFLGLMMMSFMENTQFGSFSRSQVYDPLMNMMRSSSQPLNVSGNNHFFPDSQYLRHISFQSLLQIHNQDGTEAIPRWPWFVFLSGAMGCLICSSVSHLLACHSKRFSLFFWRLDYAGISLMIVCSFFPPIYYAFYCNPFPRIFYITSITVVGILAMITLLAPAFSSARYRPFRATLFLFMGLSGVIPAVHVVCLHWGNPHIYVSLGYELLMGLLYAIGVGFYVSRVPERWKPGAFDIAGHSHQIFHVLVVLAALSHTAATLVILDFRKRSPACTF
ncbi:heptahelical transmembrane protein 3 isoform X2 [Mercurialis annua]|uniref:heptahelical transmembrane protein 3 isoform X2 n=1 Tax=Mercurialis annua TaxID=3986 RepID=UPI0021604A9A|nr:heptahelical transmembrane protein 3 isoform X2 [Mercurialis annua]